MPTDPLSEVATNHPLSPENASKYRTKIGQLNYLMVSSRPDLAVVVHQLSTFTANPSSLHNTAANHVLHYLCSQPSIPIKYTAASPLTGFCDASKTKPHATSGYIFQYNGGPVSWKCSKQTLVSQSTCEAEYISLCAAAKQAAFLSFLLRDFGVAAAPVTIFNDNQSAKMLAENPMITHRSKHIETRYHYVRQQVERKEIVIQHMPTNKLIADFFTKQLAGEKFLHFRDIIFGNKPK